MNIYSSNQISVLLRSIYYDFDATFHCSLADSNIRRYNLRSDRRITICRSLSDLEVMQETLIHENNI